MTEVRTRFAPSPTGFPHIGNFRTALYAWLLARKHDGQFVLRIEDTDQQRRVPGAAKYIVNSLAWLGLDYDEGPDSAAMSALGEPTDNAPAVVGPYAPYVQSERKERYKEVVQQLLDLGVAYRCDCTAERLAMEREAQAARKETPGYSGFCRDRAVSDSAAHVVRLKLPEKMQCTLHDAVRGNIHFDNPSLRDPVLLKSDGLPTYHLASVVDDNDMKISHVLRGEEWLSTTPIHLFLYDSLGWKKPTFCHLAHILGPDGKKLSKRHGAAALEEFAQAGYLPDAIINFIVRIGWSLGDGAEQEVFSRSELIEKFSLERLSKAGGTYDQDKLLWFNSHYINQLSDAEFTERTRPYFQAAGLEIDEERWAPLLPHIKDRCKVLPDAVTVASFLFQEDLSLDFSPIMKKKMTPAVAQQLLQAVYTAIGELDVFTATSLEILLKGLVEELDVKAGQLFGATRIAVTGSMKTPPLFESIEAVGKTTTLTRLERALSVLSD